MHYIWKVRCSQTNKAFELATTTVQLLVFLFFFKQPLSAYLELRYARQNLALAEGRKTVRKENKTSPKERLEDKTSYNTTK